MGPVCTMAQRVLSIDQTLKVLHMQRAYCAKHAPALRAADHAMFDPTVRRIDEAIEINELARGFCQRALRDASTPANAPVFAEGA